MNVRPRPAGLDPLQSRVRGQEPRRERGDERRRHRKAARPARHEQQRHGHGERHAEPGVEPQATHPPTGGAPSSRPAAPRLPCGSSRRRHVGADPRAGRPPACRPRGPHRRLAPGAPPGPAGADDERPRRAPPTWFAPQPRADEPGEAEPGATPNRVRPHRGRSTPGSSTGITPRHARRGGGGRTPARRWSARRVPAATRAAGSG